MMDTQRMCLSASKLMSYSAEVKRLPSAMSEKNTTSHFQGSYHKRRDPTENWPEKTDGAYRLRMTAPTKPSPLNSSNDMNCSGRLTRKRSPQETRIHGARRSRRTKNKSRYYVEKVEDVAMYR